MLEGEQVISLFRSIVTDPNRQSFNELNIVLDSLKSNELLNIARKIDLIEFTKSLFKDFKEFELISELGKVLTKLFNAYPADKLLTENDQLLIDALQHPSDDIREVSLKQILRISAIPSCHLPLIENLPLMRELIDQISLDNLAIATYPSKVLTNLVRTPQVIEKLFFPELNICFMGLIGKDTIVKFRVYEVIVALSCNSATIMEKASDLGYFKLLIDELDSRDELAALNALEILTDLSLTLHGGEYLDQTKMPQIVLKKFKVCMDDALFNQFLLPGFLKYFGRLSLFSPERLLKVYPEALSLILTVIEGSNIELRKIGIECLSMFGSTVEGKQCLASLVPPFEETMARLGLLIATGDSDLKEEVLIGISFLFKSHENAKFLEEIQTRWYKALAEDFTSILLGLCKLPFNRSRFSALMVTEHLASQEWGQKVIANHPGFLEFLLDKGNKKDDQTMKRNIIKAIVKSETGEDVFGTDAFERLSKSIRAERNDVVPSVAVERA